MKVNCLKTKGILMLSNYHTHTEFCDGKGWPEDYIKHACELGFSLLGFSGHAPLPFDNDWTTPQTQLKTYIATIKQLKNKYRDRIDILTGLEIDFIDGEMKPGNDVYQSLGLDYTIGSVHIIKDDAKGIYYSIDNSKEEFETLLQDVFQNNAQNLVIKYYHSLIDLVKKSTFGFLGHLDLIKKLNKGGVYFDENAKWYKRVVLDVLDIIQAKNVPIEVNTGGMSRKATTEVYPAPWILFESKKRDIPVLLNADAHAPEHINYYFKESLELLRSCGYRKKLDFKEGKWQLFSI